MTPSIKKILLILSLLLTATAAFVIYSLYIPDTTNIFPDNFDVPVDTAHNAPTGKPIAVDTIDSNAQNSSEVSTSPNGDMATVRDGYLVYNGESVFGEPIQNILLGAESEMYDMDYDVWHVFSHDDTTYILLRSNGGCGGCTNLEDNFIVISPSGEAGLTNVAGAFAPEEHSGPGGIFDRGTLDRAVISPNGTKAAYVPRAYRCDPEDYPAAECREQVHIVDFLTGQDRLHTVLKPGETVLYFTYPGPWKLIDDAVVWLSDEEILVRNSQSNHVWLSDFWSKFMSEEEGWRPVGDDVIEVYYDPSATAFDFDANGTNEYIVYYRERLNQKDVASGANLDWNGALVVSKDPPEGTICKGGCKTVVYRDEGTVGKGLPVARVLDRYNFFKLVDLDQDGTQEAVISMTQTGSGRYVDRYVLKWNGEEIDRAEFADSKTREELNEMFVRPGEALGYADLNTICIGIGDDQRCRSGSAAYIAFDYMYTDGMFLRTNYRRVEY